MMCSLRRAKSGPAAFWPRAQWGDASFSHGLPRRAGIKPWYTNQLDVAGFIDAGINLIGQRPQQDVDAVHD